MLVRSPSEFGVTLAADLERRYHGELRGDIDSSGQQRCRADGCCENAEQIHGRAQNGN